MSDWDRLFRRPDPTTEALLQEVAEKLARLAPAPHPKEPAAPPKAEVPKPLTPLPDATAFPGDTALQSEARSPHLLPPLALAYVGDAVYSLYIRKRMIEQGLTRPHNLHKGTVSYVRARAQAGALQGLIPHLTPDEQEVARRGRNAKPGSVPKGSTPGEYALSSAFEALVGYLYLARREERLGQLLSAAAAIQERDPEGKTPPG